MNGEMPLKPQYSMGKPKGFAEEIIQIIIYSMKKQENCFMQMRWKKRQMLLHVHIISQTHSFNWNLHDVIKLQYPWWRKTEVVVIYMDSKEYKIIFYSSPVIKHIQLVPWDWYRWEALDKSFPMVYDTWQSDMVKGSKSWYT